MGVYRRSGDVNGITRCFLVKVISHLSYEGGVGLARGGSRDVGQWAFQVQGEVRVTIQNLRCLGVCR